jgi:cytochrome c peroxidase
MQLSRALFALVLSVFAVTPVAAQFLEDPSPPPPSAKELDLPAVIETISGLGVVDEVSGDGANGFIKDEAAAVALGKAFYWDMQVGSDGVACGTCHYHAGADARDTNQLAPGLKGGNATFDPTPSGGGGPNYTLKAADFPIDTDDVVSSQGTFSATFNDVHPGAPGKDGRADDDCTIVSPDPFGFHLNNINVRRVEPRNTPTVINAAFNHRNFWDGRANNIFNGVDPFGQRNTGARVLEKQGANVVPISVAFENSSLASQSVGPPSSAFEMSCGEDLMTLANRNLLKIGKKMVSAEALAGQRVHLGDSVLGPYSAHPKDGLDGPGNSGIPYSDLIEAAISDRFWDSNKLFDEDKNEIGSGAPANTDEYTQMEANFSLIWGLAIQSYLRTLVSDDAPYDQWAEDPGNEERSTDEGNGRGILTAQQMRGMDLFFTNDLNLDGGPKTGLRANCSTCHQGPFFSTATFPFTIEEESGEFPEQEQLVERMRRGDGVNVIEDLLRYFVSGQGQIGAFNVSGTAGSRELPNIWRATVGGDIAVNGVPCTVESFLMNQDRTAPFPEDMIPPEPPESRGESPYADYSTKDAVFRVTGCGAPFAGPAGLEITIIDNDVGPDTGTVRQVIVPPGYAFFPSGYPFRGVYGATFANNVPIGGDFSIEIPTLYDTAFYNIGVRPTAEDPGVGANDPFGVPLSFTQQWINQLLGTPGADVDGLKSLNFGRVTEPFNWYGDSVWFPGGFAGYAWMTHDYATNPLYPGAACFDGFGGPPVLPPPPDQATCEALDPNFRWIVQSQFTLVPQVGEYFLGLNGGRGDDAIPAYFPPPAGQPPFGIPNVANAAAIASMPTAINGAFKVPNLRNVTLTAPFFHNGGQLTLAQVVEFYNRGGDFAMQNLGDLAPNMHPLGLSQQQIDDVVAFLEALTDERVRCEQAPFDHPEIRIANGARGQGGSVTPDNKNPGQSKDQLELIQAVGAGGRPANFAPCIDQENFLQ